MIGLSARQQECLDAIRAHIAEKGRPPTLREIGRRMGIGSTNGCNDHLRALERKGFIERDAGKSNGIRLIGLAAGPEYVEGPTVAVIGRCVVVNGLEVAKCLGEADAQFLANNLRAALGMVAA